MSITFLITAKATEPQDPDTPKESPEYRAIVACTPQLTTTLALGSLGPATISEHLYAKGLIPPHIHEEMIHSARLPREKAQRLVLAMTACVKINACYFDAFIGVLREQGDWTKDIVSILMDTYFTFAKIA